MCAWVGRESEWDSAKCLLLVNLSKMLLCYSFEFLCCGFEIFQIKIGPGMCSSFSSTVTLKQLTLMQSLKLWGEHTQHPDVMKLESQSLCSSRPLIQVALSTFFLKNEHLHERMMGKYIGAQSHNGTLCKHSMCFAKYLMTLKKLLLCSVKKKKIRLQNRHIGR